MEIYKRNQGPAISPDSGYSAGDIPNSPPGTASSSYIPIIVWGLFGCLLVSTLVVAIVVFNRRTAAARANRSPVGTP
ncbi:hypothetical protein C5167_021602 [Papaver somniferum]|nr:hypothetical protein C5167_021602 [Papaver somniferum]